MTRQSIEIEGLHHSGQPIPAASRLGNIVATGGIYGLDPATGEVPDDMVPQVRLMFLQLARLLEAAGSGFGQVVRMTIYVRTNDARDAINTEWCAAFPDPASRPARHTILYDHLPRNLLVQCDALAVVDN